MTKRTMTAKGVSYAVKAIIDELGFGHLSVHTKEALGKYVTTVIVQPANDRNLRFRIADTLRNKLGWKVDTGRNGSVTMVSEKIWY